MLSSAELSRAACALAVATLLALRGARRKSLSKSGAAAAFLVGFVSWSSSLRFGATLIAFYLSSTRATQYKAAVKKRMEDGYTSAAGNRTAAQVFASSLPAVVVAAAYALIFRFDAPIAPAFFARSALLLAYLLFFAACAGDTFASELGLVLPGEKSEPLLITAPWRRVPRGTNGGVTWQGTVASAAGGAVVASVYFLTGPEWSFSQLWLLWVGVIGGIVGSALDSVIGAVLQASWLDTVSGKVLKEAPSVEQQSEKRYKHVCGMDLMGGEAVNAMAAMVTMLLAPVLLPYFAVPVPGVVNGA